MIKSGEVVLTSLVVVCGSVAWAVRPMPGRRQGNADSALGQACLVGEEQGVILGLGFCRL